jgi:transposase
MESEALKTQQLLRQVAELERAVGQKQLEIDFLNKLLELGSEELGFDLKKNYSARLFNGSVITGIQPNTPTP